MKRPESDDPDINTYIDHLINENDELKIELAERKSKRSLEKEYKELVSDILVACKAKYEKNKEKENKLASFTFLVISYIKTFSDDYKTYF